MNHAPTVQQIYEAFGRGDFPAVLSHLADDVVWEYGDTSTDVPWLQPRRGRAAVAGFFESLAALEFHVFQPTRLLADGDVVVSLIQLDVTVRATGRRIVEADEVHIWQFDADGRATRFRHRVDTHLHWAALHGHA